MNTSDQGKLPTWNTKLTDKTKNETKISLDRMEILLVCRGIQPQGNFSKIK